MTAPGPQPDPVHLLSLAEHRAVRHQTAVLEAEAAGCSIEQWRVLNLLADDAGHTMTEVADHALLPAPTATKLVDRLVNENLVYRHPDPADRRRVLVYAADRGRELHARLAAALARTPSGGAGPGVAELLDRVTETLSAPAQ